MRRRKTPFWYRKDGKPIWDTLTAAKLFENSHYRRVAETTLDDGTWISTVWLGIDHSFTWHDGANPRPIIFETMVFSPGKTESGVTGRAHREDWDQNRYVTEAEAIAGHDAMVRKWRAIREAWKRGGLVPEDSPEQYRSKRTNLN